MELLVALLLCASTAIPVMAWLQIANATGTVPA